MATRYRLTGNHHIDLQRKDDDMETIDFNSIENKTELEELMDLIGQISPNARITVIVNGVNHSLNSGALWNDLSTMWWDLRKMKAIFNELRQLKQKQRRTISGAPFLLPNLFSEKIDDLINLIGDKYD